MYATLERIDNRVTSFLRKWSEPALRISVALVFIWFGALKIFDVTPVSELVANTVYWFDPAWVVPTLGVVEVAVGLGLLFKVALRSVLALFFLQMLGTFLVFIVQPDVAFVDGNPLLLTTEGEFVVKNLVLLSAGLVIGATGRPPRVAAGKHATTV
ncbi:MAG TPA: DoxX family membrane protein [Acidimicrobiia bacterium]|nr:DoxX family membrane protein [Acidimicrobiia bacterium]